MQQSQEQCVTGTGIDRESIEQKERAETDPRIYQATG
jgi:hypothetical protein